MSNTIETEAGRNAKLAVDIDNMRSRYKEDDLINNLSVTFPVPEIYAYENKFFVLISKSKKEKFKTRWSQRPDYVSYEFYGNTIFWTLILFVNRINSIEDFINLGEILIPPFDLILELVKDKIPITEKENLKEKKSTMKSNMYKVFPLDQKELNSINAKKNLN